MTLFGQRHDTGEPARIKAAASVVDAALKLRLGVEGLQRGPVRIDCPHCATALGLTVAADHQTYACRSCAATGDVFTLWQRTLGLGFADALADLKRVFGGAKRDTATGDLFGGGNG